MNINIAREVNELKTLGRSLGATAFASVSVIPMIVLGWLVSAISRSPVADAALRTEAAYKVIVFWQGGTKSLPIVLLLLLLLVSLLLFAYLFSSRGVGQEGDGMGFARTVVLKLLLPMFLSSTAFMAGVVGNSTFSSLIASLIVFAGYVFFAGYLHYVVNTTSPVSNAPAAA